LCQTQSAKLTKPMTHLAKDEGPRHPSVDMGGVLPGLCDAEVPLVVSSALDLVPNGVFETGGPTRIWHSS
jgi:hypothetical protein